MIRPLSLSTCHLTIAAALLLSASVAEARTFISPMGEPFRDGADGAAPAEAWFVGVDKNGDGKLSRAEFMADAGRFFMVLNLNRDNEIGPDEIEHYEEDIAPEVQTGGFGGGVPGAGRGPRKGGGGGGGGHGHGGGGGHGGGRGGGGHGGGAEGASGDSPAGPSEPAMQGAARFAYLDLPEPIVAADTDFNRGVSVNEFAAAANARFALLDTNHDGVITRDDLAQLGRSGGGGKHGGGWKQRPSEGYSRPD